MRGQRVEPCSYCGLDGTRVNGKNCPAYGTQCEICRKFNHYSSVEQKRVQQINCMNFQGHVTIVKRRE